MKLKLGTAVHEIARRSESEFEVDGVRVTVSLTSDGASGFRAKAGGRTASMFVARQGERVYAQVGERAYVLTVVNRSSLGSTNSERVPPLYDDIFGLGFSSLTDLPIDIGVKLCTVC